MAKCFFDERKIEVTNVAIWGDNKKFSYLKEIPKNGEERWSHINDRLLEILERRLKDRAPDKCRFFSSDEVRLDFVFHFDGEPVSYRQAQYHYNKALKKAGLHHEFSSTHILRKAMAKATRDHLGLDAAQAVGGWKDRKVVEDIYTDVPHELTKNASTTIEKLLYAGNGDCPEPDIRKKVLERPKLRLV